MKNLLIKLIDVPLNGSNGHAVLNGNGRLNGHTNVIGYHGVNRNGQLKNGQETIKSSSRNELISSNEFEKKEQILRDRFAKGLYFLPPKISKFLSMLLDNFIRYILLSWWMGPLSFLIGSKNFLRATNQLPGKLRKAESTNNFIKEIQEVRHRIETEGMIPKEEFFKIISQWAADWTGLNSAFWWEFDSKTSTLANKFYVMNSLQSKNPVLHAAIRSFELSPFSKIKLKKEEYFEAKEKNKHGAIFSGIYEGKSIFVRDLENIPKDIPMGFLESFLVSFFSTKATIIQPVGFDENKGNALGLLILIDEKTIPGNEDIYIKSLLVNSIAELGSDIFNYANFDSKMKNERDALLDGIKKSHTQTLAAASQQGYDSVEFLQKQLELKDQVDLVNRHTLVNKINESLLNLMSRKILEKNEEKNQIEEQKEIIERFAEYEQMRNIAILGPIIANQHRENTQNGMQIKIPFSNSEKAIRILDLRNSTSYGEFLNDPTRVGKLMDIFHTNFDEVTIDFKGTINNNMGDGSLHLYDKTVNSLVATYVSMKNLKETSEIANLAIAKVYFDAAIKASIKSTKGFKWEDKQKNDLIQNLYRSITTTYNIQKNNFVMFEDFRQRLALVLKNVNSENDLKLSQFDVFGSLKNLSYNLYEDYLNFPGNKIEPLFNFNFSIGVGLNYGTVSSGSIGNRIIQFISIADSINTAARVEAANKDYGSTVLATEFFMENLLGKKSIKEKSRVRIKYSSKDSFILNYELKDSKRFKGKSQSVKIYSLDFEDK